MCSRTVLSLTLFPRGGVLSCHNTIAPNSWCHSSHCKEGISEFTGSVVIYTDVTQNKMCLTDICGAAQIKPAHEQNQGKKKISLCNWAHSKQQAWLSRADQNGKPPSGVSYPVNLTLLSLTLSWEQIQSYSQELGDVFLLICIIFSSVLLTGNDVNLCLIIFSFVCVYELEWTQLKVPENTNLKKKSVLFFFSATSFLHWSIALSLQHHSTKVW